MCKASIIIPAYNSGQYIGKTIDSILAQTYQDFECIIIDDGSTDNTLSVVKSYEDVRIKTISLPNSGGPAIPRNAGMSVSKGDYIFMFDSDDIMHPKKLELSIRALEDHTEADILFTNFSSIDEQDKIINADFLNEYDSLWNLLGGKPSSASVIEINAKEIYSALIKVNFVGTSSVVLRKSALSLDDIFNENLKNSDDRLFWVLFTRNHNALYLNETLHSYRIQSNSISNRGFIRRGPSKIEALKIIFYCCDDRALRKHIKIQISNDYATLAYAFRRADEVTQQRKATLAGLKWNFNFRLAKLFFQSIVRIGITSKVKN